MICWLFRLMVKDVSPDLLYIVWVGGAEEGVELRLWLVSAGPALPTLRWPVDLHQRQRSSFHQPCPDTGLIPLYLFPCSPHSWWLCL